MQDGCPIPPPDLPSLPVYPLFGCLRRLPCFPLGPTVREVLQILLYQITSPGWELSQDQQQGRLGPGIPSALSILTLGDLPTTRASDTTSAARTPQMTTSGPGSSPPGSSLNTSPCPISDQRHSVTVLGEPQDPHWKPPSCQYSTLINGLLHTAHLGRTCHLSTSPPGPV